MQETLTSSNSMSGRRANLPEWSAERVAEVQGQYRAQFPGTTLSPLPSTAHATREDILTAIHGYMPAPETRRHCRWLYPRRTLDVMPEELNRIAGNTSPDDIGVALTIERTPDDFHAERAAEGERVIFTGALRDRTGPLHVVNGPLSVPASSSASGRSNSSNGGESSPGSSVGSESQGASPDVPPNSDGEGYPFADMTDVSNTNDDPPPPYWQDPSARSMNDALAVPGMEHSFTVNIRAKRVTRPIGSEPQLLVQSRFHDVMLVNGDMTFADFETSFWCLVSGQLYPRSCDARGRFFNGYPIREMHVKAKREIYVPGRWFARLGRWKVERIKVTAQNWPDIVWSMLNEYLVRRLKIIYYIRPES